MEPTEFLNEQAIYFNNFGYSQVDMRLHLLCQKLEELSILFYRFAGMRHNFRPYGPLCRSDKLNVMLHSPL